MTLTDAVSFDIYITAGDLTQYAQWPPPRFADRDRRLRQLNDLWRGDFSELSVGDNRPNTANSGTTYVQPGTVNYFKSYSTKLANLLLMSAPLLGGSPDAEPATSARGDAVEGDAPTPVEQVDNRVDLSDPAYDALIDLTRYGGCLISESDGVIEIIDPSIWYPGVDGDAWTVEPYTSTDATSPEPDRARVRYFPAEGGVGEQYEVEYAGDGRIGDELESDDEPTFTTSRIVIVQRTPRIGIWGTAAYIDLCGPVLEISRRLARNSDLLDLYTGPIPTLDMSEADAEARWPAGDIAVDPANPTAAERRRAILTGERQLVDQGFIHLRDDLVGVDFLQPDIDGVDTALAQVEELQQAIQSLTGLPSLAGERQPPSGEAMKRIYLPFYAESSALQKTLVLGLEQLLGQPVEWPHIFDILEAQGMARQREMMAMMAARDGDDDSVLASE